MQISGLLKPGALYGIIETREEVRSPTKPGGAVVVDNRSYGDAVSPILPRVEVERGRSGLYFVL